MHSCTPPSRVFLQVAQFAALFALGGLPAVVWGGALRMVWVYHITWAVNSATHVWGNVQYKTGDLSRNNWCVRVCVPCLDRVHDLN